MESRFPCACRFDPASTFQRSILSLVKSACVAFEDASNCVNNPLSWVIEAYETGAPGPAAAPCAEYPAGAALPEMAVPVTAAAVCPVAKLHGNANTPIRLAIR